MNIMRKNATKSLLLLILLLMSVVTIGCGHVHTEDCYTVLGLVPVYDCEGVVIGSKEMRHYTCGYPVD